MYLIPYGLYQLLIDIAIWFHIYVCKLYSMVLPRCHKNTCFQTALTCSFLRGLAICFMELFHHNILHKIAPSQTFLLFVHIIFSIYCMILKYELMYLWWIAVLCKQSGYPILSYTISDQWSPQRSTVPNVINKWIRLMRHHNSLII